MVVFQRLWIERYLQAQRHVVSGRAIIERQRALIARKKVEGRNTEESEDLLANFEQTQAIFEDDLTRMNRESDIAQP